MFLKSFLLKTLGVYQPKKTNFSPNSLISSAVSVEIESRTGAARVRETTTTRKKEAIIRCEKKVLIV